VELIGRTGWGAQPPKAKPVTIAKVTRLFLHHSVSPDGGPETVRAIQTFHQRSRGWNDIAYTWLYSPRDRVFYEGRGPLVAGAHTSGYNRTAHGLCVLGNYHVEVPAPHVAVDVAAWARWHGDTYGPDQYQTHSSVAATACPGKYLEQQLEAINKRAKQPSETLPQPGPAPTIPPTLRRGDRGDDVRFLQGAIGARPVDGIFGPKTEQAVRLFQQANGLKVDGICGPQTWRRILAL
jgi:peptidoglycan hydrolase-like protein with peptidoglycan-binding domain